MVVVSPLVALMQDQVKAFRSKRLSAGYMSEGSSPQMKLGVLSRAFQLVFFSSEAILNQKKWRYLLRQEPYFSHLVPLVVDEAHCVKKW